MEAESQDDSTVLNILYAAFFSTVAIYFGIGLYLSTGSHSGVDMQHVLGLPFMTLALLGVSIIQFPVAIFLRRHLYFGKEFDDAEERSGTPDIRRCLSLAGPSRRVSRSTGLSMRS